MANLHTCAVHRYDMSFSNPPEVRLRDPSLRPLCVPCISNVAISMIRIPSPLCTKVHACTRTLTRSRMQQMRLASCRKHSRQNNTARASCLAQAKAALLYIHWTLPYHLSENLFRQTVASGLHDSVDMILSEGIAFPYIVPDTLQAFRSRTRKQNRRRR